MLRAAPADARLVDPHGPIGDQGRVLVPRLRLADRRPVSQHLVSSPRKRSAALRVADALLPPSRSEAQRSRLEEPQTRDRRGRMTDIIHVGAKNRRDELREEGLCINGRSHGPATHGCLCWPCRAMHRGLCKTRAEAPPLCDHREGHDLVLDEPIGKRCDQAATHRIEWEDGQRYSYGCDAHLTIDEAATVKPSRIVKL